MMKTVGEKLEYSYLSNPAVDKRLIAVHFWQVKKTISRLQKTQRDAETTGSS